MQPDGLILVRRYSRHDLESQPFHAFDPGTGSIAPATPGEPAGWLVDGERVIDGQGPVVFGELDGQRIVGMMGRAFHLGVEVTLVHHHGPIVSSLSVMAKGSPLASLKYLTPWWRSLWDDGSHPDLNDPLRYFSGRWTGN